MVRLFMNKSILQGRITKYEYDNQSRLSVVLNPWSEEQRALDKAEAAEAGLYFTLDKGQGERYSFGTEELAKVREVLNQAGVNRGALVSGSQIVWRESYGYDGNGNRIRKSTPWGTIVYEYDGENRMVKKGNTAYSYDKDGNLIGETGRNRTVKYEYNGQNRMVYSEVVEGSVRSITGYEYDGLGRRTIVQEAGREGMRTVYDGMSFEIIREGVTFLDGSLTTKYASGMVVAEEHNEGMRYRWLGGESESGVRTTRTEGSVSATAVRYTGISVSLYGNGEAVGMNRMRNPEERYEYDAGTGLYNYGYRDYKAEATRFTTVDPIRDGANWFAYVNNDPVNWIDLWGLRPLTTEERAAHANASDSPVDYDRIEFIDGLPTPEEVRSIAEGIGIDTRGIDESQIQDWIDSAAALSLPNGTIYVPSDLNQGKDEQLLSTVHEIEHQAQFQNNDVEKVVSELIAESQMPGRTAYTTPGTWEYEAQQVENRAAQQMREQATQQTAPCNR
jgi:RHS repeat-associated protein